MMFSIPCTIDRHTSLMLVLAHVDAIADSVLHQYPHLVLHLNDHLLSFDLLLLGAENVLNTLLYLVLLFFEGCQSCVCIFGIALVVDLFAHIVHEFAEDDEAICGVALEVFKLLDPLLMLLTLLI